MAGKSTAPQKSIKSKAHILIIESRYYEAVATALLDGAVAELKASGATYKVITVPGALELPQALAQAEQAGLIPGNSKKGRFDGAVILGCVIRGETSHYDVVVDNSNQWLMRMAINRGIPLGNALLTVDTEAQAMARAGNGRSGKGGDAVRACLSVLELKRSFQDFEA